MRTSKLKTQSSLLSYAIGVCAAAAILAACGGGGGSSAVAPQPPPTVAPSSPTPITHIVVLVQENRTFNNLFATYPGTAGTTVGKMRTGTGSGAKTVPINLKEVNLLNSVSLVHTYPGFITGYRGGNMDAFNLIIYGPTQKPEGDLPYQYVNPQQVVPYWDMAQQYAIADNMFQTQGSGSYTAHQDLIRGGTSISSTESLIDDPTKMPWGCTAPAGTTTSLITTSLKYEKNTGPFPCTSDFPSQAYYKTMQDLLDAKRVTWKYYTPTWQGNTGNIWNAFLTISSVYGNQNEWNAHISTPETNIFTDISNGKLPAMSWLIPDGANSDHPAFASDTGPSWVASVVNAIGKSSYWKSTAIVIVWDDWGGYYDPVKPPALDTQGGPGFRVPMIVISPYVPQGEIAHTTYEFGSILRFVEDTFSLGRLGTTDQTATSIVNIFNFKQSPRSFSVIPSKYSRAYLIHRGPSGLPVDTE